MGGGAWNHLNVPGKPASGPWNHLTVPGEEVASPTWNNLTVPGSSLSRSPSIRSTGETQKKKIILVLQISIGFGLDHFAQGSRSSIDCLVLVYTVQYKVVYL
jgi:hypothetical protein